MAKTILIVDGHVHFYNCYDPDKFFDAAIKNLNNLYNVLCSEENDYFSRFRANDNLGKQFEYKFENTQEDCSIILSKGSEHLCYILAGRQIVTRENLEVLSIASDKGLKTNFQSKMLSRAFLIKKKLWH